MPGYTHVSLCEVIEEFLVVHDPCLGGCRTTFRTKPLTDEWDRYMVIEVVTYPTHNNKLIKPIFQTCATIVQYLAGINMGATLAQGLYQTLTHPDTLFMDGIREIKIWEPQQQYQPSSAGVPHF